MAQSPHRIAILGGGPIGLEAALAAGERGFPFTLYEASGEIAGNVREWGHVSLFTPWDLDVSPRMRRALTEAGQSPPAGDECPTGRELVDQALRPAASLPGVQPHLRLGHLALAIGRRGLLKHEEIASARRKETPFRILLIDDTGREWTEEADIVLDCTGTWGHPNTLGDGGISAPGEHSLAAAIRHDIPDFEREAGDWLGKTILLAGGGHSAQTAARRLARLAARDEARNTRVYWVLRSADPRLGTVADDPLPARARLVIEANRLARGESPAILAKRGCVVDTLAPSGRRIEVTLRETEGTGRETVTVDRIVSLTGCVGDHRLYRQLQVHECYATCGPMKLSAALLGAGGGDCMQQTSHGAQTLVNPEPGFFILGSKSYGRHNTFLMRVGWPQVDEVFGLLGE